MNLTPTTRKLPSGKIVVFYSPQQIEEIIPVTVRLQRQKEMTSHINPLEHGASLRTKSMFNTDGTRYY